MTSTNSTSRSPCPPRRASFSLDEKRRVLEHLRATGRVRETIACFYPQLPPEAYDARRRLVLNWRRNAREILAGASTRQGAARRRMRKPKAPKPQPPVPRGLAGDQDEPSTGLNEREMPEFEPIRSSFSLDEKRRVLEHLAACKNVRETIDKFYPDLPPEEYNTRRRTIWRWRACAEQIVAGCADDKASARKKMRPRGIVCQRGPKSVGPQDVVDRLLTSVKKSEQRALKRKSKRPVLRPAPPAPALLAERQMDAIVFSALGLPPTTQFRPIRPAPAPATPATTTAGSASVSTRSNMHPLQRGEVSFAIRRR
ncbi:hypothetical protein PHYSODRAFT_493586 [Phytophthora sojae]|uniref:Uncharacterized protein n=1 Tax=Phytophthora sojae (strain P6497) TaxID=1094619 RepID=G4Z1X2_PHYSP|nr:hypothetical protein PHYSODRAFT_493586 [Phytophthora sojae]EGZ19970.1 hypothetical protein PHYSODRAFT_493586 [Phytophthora sojae]|eukprot:XP_009522687.1 hypothetical protein PHYSODRAFT_493586 [Phytophthora sojae]